MNAWRWLGISIFLLGTVCFLGTEFSALEALAKGKDDKKVEVSTDPAKATLEPGKKMDVAVKLKRGKDAKKDVTLSAEITPKDKGVTVKVDEKVAADKSEAKLAVETTDKAEETDYKITIKSKSTDSEDSTATFALTVKKGEVAKKEVQPVKGALVFEAFKGKNKFYQLQDTETKQDMKVMGQNVVQTQKQKFLIEWTPQDVNKDGDFVVTQRIIGVEMEINIGGNKIAYKSTTDKQKNPMTDFFEQLLKQELKFTIKSDLSEVKSIEGRDAFIKGLSDINPQMQSLLKNILSDDALKKMAEPTWFAFPKDGILPEVGKSWTRKSELNLGPIGKYSTEFEFTYKGPDPKDKDKERIDIKTTLTYTAPTEKAGLPFIIHDAKLTASNGTGSAVFDRKKGRFESTEIKMNLNGDLTIEVGSMKTTVSLAQTQTASSTTFDAIPEAWNPKKQ
jgi:hypothetical protein